MVSQNRRTFWGIAKAFFIFCAGGLLFTFLFSFREVESLRVYQKLSSYIQQAIPFQIEAIGKEDAGDTGPLTGIENNLRNGANYHESDLVLEGRKRLEQAEPDKAERFFLAALKLNPFNIPALLDLSLAKLELAQPAEAIPYLKRVVKLDRTNDVAFYNLACAYALLEDAPKAVKSLHRALLLNKDFVSKAKTDPDFARIRNHELFLGIIKVFENEVGQ